MSLAEKLIEQVIRGNLNEQPIGAVIRMVPSMFHRPNGITEVVFEETPEPRSSWWEHKKAAKSFNGFGPLVKRAAIQWAVRQGVPADRIFVWVMSDAGQWVTANKNF